MKNQFSTSLKLIVVVVFSNFLFIQANAQCQANFVLTINGCTVAFANTSTGTNNNTYYYWNFGNGQTSTQQNPSHTYSASGSYQVCLTLYSSDSLCNTTFCKWVTVQCPTAGGCIANFQWYPDSSNSCMIYFYNTSTGTNNNTNYYWSFPGGSPSSSNTQYPSITYATSGTYQVCLTIMTNTSPVCIDTLCKNVTVQCGGGGGSGIADLIDEQSISVYPNPSSGKFQIAVDNRQSTIDNMEMAIYNMMGEKVFQTNISKQATVSLNEPDGIYWLHMNTGEKSVTKKIVLIK